MVAAEAFGWARCAGGGEIAQADGACNTLDAAFVRSRRAAGSEPPAGLAGAFSRDRSPAVAKNRQAGVKALLAGGCGLLYRPALFVSECSSVW
jgi:hypothetical protein